MSRRIPTIGYITPQIHSNYLRSLLAGVQQAARERETRLAVFQTTPYEVVTSCLGLDVVDGWIAIFYSGRYDTTRNDEALAALLQTGRPLVMISQAVPGAPVVVTDNIGGMRAAVRHLLDLGHRRIAFVGIADNPDIPDRLEGYRQALAERGIPFDPALVFSTPNGEFESGRIAAEQLVAAGLPCTAVAFGNDYNALGALETLRAAAVRVPDDLAITGFDDVPEAQITTPPLTTVRMRFDAMGRVAAEHLLDTLAGAPMSAAPISVPTALVVRRSAGEHIESTSRATETIARADLARELAEKVGSPTPLAPDEPPERLWSGVHVILRAVEAALDGSTPPDDVAIQQSWDTAIGIASYADPLHDALVLIETTLATALASRPADDPAHSRAAATMRRLRTALLRVCLGAKVQQVNRSEGALYASNRVARVLADSDLDTVCQLGWLSDTDVAGAALALWDDDRASGDMKLVGSYPDTRAAAPQPIVAEQFPPLDLWPQKSSAVVTVLPLESARRDWGALALTLPNEYGMAALDNTSLLAALLTARIDSATLQRDLETQKAIILEAYARERALSNTVRELGCPVIPLRGAALLVPLIGTIDSQRAVQIISTVLHAIEVHRASKVLLDITGVPLIDTQVAGTLVQLAQTAQLLGARAILIGVRPEIAQSIVGLDIDLRALTTYASLADALTTLSS
jgi:DNA-binding LacI/PurR family transcriptional regulator/anti-anti-sigma regulatory factor